MSIKQKKYLNANVQQYHCWKPDPGKMKCIYTQLAWLSHIVFNKEMSSKIGMDHAEAIVVIAMWPTQPHYSKAMGMLVQQLILLPKTLDLLRLLFSPNSQHPLLPKLQLLACKLSGVHLESQQTLSSLPGTLGLVYNIQHTSTSGSSTHINKWLKYSHQQVAQVLWWETSLSTLPIYSRHYFLLDWPKCIWPRS